MPSPNQLFLGLLLAAGTVPAMAGDWGVRSDNEPAAQTTGEVAAITHYRNSAYLLVRQRPGCSHVQGPAQGNLKKFRLAPSGSSDGDSPSLQSTLVDAQSPPVEALDDTRRIRADALSFWTDADQNPELSTGDLNGDGVAEPPERNRHAPGNPPGVYSGRDGGLVMRGGAGQKIPGFRVVENGPGDANGPGRRNLFYLSQSRGHLMPLDLTDAVADELGGRLRRGGYAASLAHDPRFPAYTQRHHVRRLIQYVRGQDVGDEDGTVAADRAVDYSTRLEFSDPEYTEARQWLMGDAPHGEPLLINYGPATLDNRLHGGTERFTASRPALFIAIAANDGLLRLIRDVSADGVEDGREIWAFMPDESMGAQERLLSGRAATDGEYVQPQILDGSPVAIVIDRDGNARIDAGTDRVILVLGLRRGGRGYYALDISNPYQPEFLWKISPAGRRFAGSAATTGAADYAELGLAFSRPRVGFVPARSQATHRPGNRRLALFIGGGYDGGPPSMLGGAIARPGKDHRGPGTDSRMGNAIFVLDALTGELIWKAVGGARTGPGNDQRVFTHANLRDSIPSELTVLDLDGDGLQDRILVGDSGGNLWRADLGAQPSPPSPAQEHPPPVTADWRLSRIACLGRHGGDTCSPVAGKRDDRRFFHPPDLVQLRDGERRANWVLIGSGDLENPLDLAPAGDDPGGQELRGGPVTLNRLYAVRDLEPSDGPRVDLDLTHIKLRNATQACHSPPCSGAAGWYLDLQQRATDGTAGEKILSTPITVAHTIYVTSFTPPSRDPTAACDPGRGSLYALRLMDGRPSRGAFPPGPTDPNEAGYHALSVPGIPPRLTFLSTAAVGEAATDSACPAILLAGTEPVATQACAGFRTYWRRAE